MSFDLKEVGAGMGSADIVKALEQLTEAINRGVSVYWGEMQRCRDCGGSGWAFVQAPARDNKRRVIDYGPYRLRDPFNRVDIDFVYVRQTCLSCAGSGKQSLA